MASKLDRIEVDGELMGPVRASSGSQGRRHIKGHSDVGMDAVEAEYRRRKAQADYGAQHGPVKVIVKDGMPVNQEEK